MPDLKTRIKKILEIDQPFLASLATVSEQCKPRVRFVMPKASEDLTLRIATFQNSNKVLHIRSNSEVHLICGVTDPTTSEAYVQIEGTASILTDETEKKAFWSEGLTEYFKGPEDPNYVVIKIIPSRIQVYFMPSMNVETWKPE